MLLTREQVHQGSIKELIGWNEDIKNKTIVVIEDIVDTGNTLERIVDELVIRKAAEVRIAALLYKPDAYTKEYTSRLYWF